MSLGGGNETAQSSSVYSAGDPQRLRGRVGMKTKKRILKAIVSILIGLTWVASHGASLAQTRPTFQHIVIDPNPVRNGSPLHEKALVDIDGDGKLDAVLGAGRVNGSPGGLYWYKAPSSGRLSDPWIKHTIASYGDFFEGIAIYDVNGDGTPDIIASSENKLVWFENPSGRRGDPASDPWPMHVIRAKGGAHEIVLGDIDGDGKIDVICSSSGELKVSGAILFQNTPDSWTEIRFGKIGESVALLDIGAGMGTINIVAGYGNRIIWYENPRESGGDARRGTWIRHVAAVIAEAGENTFATGVFSPSGRMDLIVGSNEDHPHNPPGLYRVIAPADRRSAWTVQTIDSTYVAMHQISLADMNDDGTLDLIILEAEQAHNTGPDFNQNFNKQRVAIFYNDGTGNFTPEVIATSGGHNQVVGDVEGNGDAGHPLLQPRLLWRADPTGTLGAACQ